MRDPKRIRPFLKKIAEKWEKNPDLRFGQLVIKFSSGKGFKSEGSNRFPYNFCGFLDLMGISEIDF